jgi:uncharacterized UBP type Zn finger protein
MVFRSLGDEIRRVSFQRSFRRRQCDHVSDVGASSVVRRLACPRCASEGADWVHLRMCQTCGSVGCCDTSAGRHAAQHFSETGHPVMRSIEPGEAWGWCYVDRAYIAQFSPTSDR